MRGSRSSTREVGRGRLTIRMHVQPEQVQDWNEAKMVEMARKIETMAASEAARPGAPSLLVMLEKPAEPVIAIDRIKLTGSLTVRRVPGTPKHQSAANARSCR